MKLKIAFIGFFIIIFSLISIVNSSTVTVQYPLGHVTVQKIYTTNVISGQDLHINLAAELVVKKSYFSNNYTYINIYFRPGSLLASNVRIDSSSISACEGRIDGIGKGYGSVSIYCNSKLNVTMNYTGGDSIDLEILTLTSSNNSKNIVLNISYILNDFVIDQGDYHVIEISYPNMESMSERITSYVSLPKNTSILYRLPEDAKTIWDGKWVIELNGWDQKFIWYTDEEEKTRHEMDLMQQGVIWDAILSIMFLLIGILIGRYINRNEEKRTVLYNEVFPPLHKEIKEKLDAISSYDKFGVKRCSGLHEERDKLMNNGKYEIIPKKKYLVFPDDLRAKIDEFYDECNKFDEVLNQATQKVYEVVKKEFEKEGISGLSAKGSYDLYYERLLGDTLTNYTKLNEQASVLFNSPRTIPKLKITNEDLKNKPFTYNELIERIHNKVKGTKSYSEFRTMFRDIKNYNTLLKRLKR